MSPPRRPDSTTGARSRPWWSLSIRALMVLVLLVGGLAGWAANTIRSQRLAVATIRAAGGTVQYDWQKRPAAPPPGPNAPRRVRPTGPPAPRWLRRMTGDELFQSVRLVSLNAAVTPALVAALARFDRLEILTLHQTTPITGDLGDLRHLRHLESLEIRTSAATDATLGQIARLTPLRELVIFGGVPAASFSPAEAGIVRLAALPHLTRLEMTNCRNLSDDGAARLVAGLPRLNGILFGGGLPTVAKTLAACREHHPDLEELGLDATGVRDDDLRTVAKLTGLRKLQFQRTAITDAGVAHLRPLANLERLTITVPGLTDAGLPHIAALPALRSLSIGGSRVTDGGLIHLAPLTNLVELHVDRTAVTDAGLPTLARLPSLDRLGLILLPITDAGLMALARLPRLKSLDLRGTKVTPSGVAALRRAVPTLTQVTTATPRSASAPAAPAAGPVAPK